MAFKQLQFFVIPSSVIVQCKISGASIPSQQMPTPKTNGDNRPYCRCVPLGPRESLADRISKYIRFEHQGITYTAGELQCTEFISVSLVA